jgi:cation transporter-like permease
MTVRDEAVRRTRRIAGWAAVVTFLTVLGSTLVGGPVSCEVTSITNAAGVSISGPPRCPLTAVVPLVLLGVFLIAWTATVAWAAARRRAGVEPETTEVPMFPQGF